MKIVLMEPISRDFFINYKFSFKYLRNEFAFGCFLEWKKTSFRKESLQFQENPSQKALSAAVLPSSILASTIAPASSKTMRSSILPLWAAE